MMQVPRATALIAVILSFFVPVASAAPLSAQDQVWSLEKAYWKYVQTNDLQGYSALWNDDFVGWPSVSPEPLRKGRITDWITTHTSKGETLKSYNLQRLIIQVTGNITITTYRVRLTWAGKKGAGQPSTTRIIHTWVRNAGRWQIISGMSAPTDAQGR